MVKQRRRVDLNDAQRTAFVALLMQRERVLNDANTALRQIDAALRELARLFAGADGYVLAQDVNGTLYLQLQSGEQQCQKPEPEP